MSVHRAAVTWALDGGDFLARRYSRAHTLSFEGGLEVAGSPSPHIVPAPYSRADAVDPEAAFTASLSACHMLWFLDHASRAGFVVASYLDQAEGTLARNAAGKLAMTRVALRPKIAFSGDPRPTPQEIAALHHAAHADCFIANSVTAEVVVEEP
ncbi:MAG: OsmC family protein [Caulobacteraceae bacterium]|nr:OsmC family protein [Caulobacteraceae bacterium]